MYEGVERLGKYLKISTKHENIWLLLTQKCSQIITFLEGLVLQDVTIGGHWVKCIMMSLDYFLQMYLQ